MNDCECYFCGDKKTEIADAIEAGWIPHFYDGKDEVSFPACDKCQRHFIRVGANGEYERKPETIYHD